MKNSPIFIHLLIITIFFCTPIFVYSEDGRLSYQPVEEFSFEKNNSQVKSSFYSEFHKSDLEYILINRHNSTLDQYNRNGLFLTSTTFEESLDYGHTTNLVQTPLGEFLQISNQSTELLRFNKNGQTVNRLSLRGKIDGGKRIAEFNAKVHQFMQQSVYLDFTEKVITLDKAGKTQQFRYEQLTADATVVMSEEQSFLVDPTTRRIIDLSTPNKTFTGETVLLSKRGQTFILDREKEQIFQYSSDGELSSFYGPMGKEGPFCRDFTFFANGDVAILDGRDTQVYIYGTDGMRRIRFGSRGKETGKWHTPSGIIVDGQNRVIVHDQWNEMASVHEVDGSFLFEMKDLIAGELPRGISVYLTSDNQLYFIDYLNKICRITPAAYALLKEIDKIFDSNARYPRKYISMTPDGFLLFFDMAKNQYSLLRHDGSLKTIKVAETLASFLVTDKEHFVELQLVGDKLIGLTEKGRIYQINQENGQIIVIPFDFSVQRMVSDGASRLLLITTTNQVLATDLLGKIDFNKKISRKSLVLAAYPGEYFLAVDEKIQIYDFAGAEIGKYSLGMGQTIRQIIPTTDFIYLFFEKNRHLGLTRLKRKNIYKEALQYYNNSLYRMAAVRLEKLLQENNEGPETHYLLYQCYQRLKKPDSAENIAAKLRRKWPTSKQTKQLPGGIDER